MKISLVLLACGLVATTLACRSGSGGGGVTSKADKIANEAVKREGSTLWSFTSTHKIGAYKNKCNIFVAEMIEAAGATAPHRHWWKWSPIAANVWDTSSSSITCWKHVSSSKRGDVIGYLGHVGIVTGYHMTTSASSIAQKIVTNNWGFHSGENPVFWRYNC